MKVCLAVLMGALASVSQAQQYYYFNIDRLTDEAPISSEIACHFYLFDELKSEIGYVASLRFDGEPTIRQTLGRFTEYVWFSVTAVSGEPDDGWPIPGLTNGVEFNISVRCQVDETDRQVLIISVEPGPFVGETAEPSPVVLTMSETTDGVGPVSFAVSEEVHRGKY